MAQAGEVAQQQQQRRPNQDYTSAWHLFTERQWTKVSSKLTLREKAECVLEEAWLQLGMRLPSETTLATFTAVCFLLSSENATAASSWQLATSYQTVKTVWKSLSKRLVRVQEVEPRAPFLQVLPQNFNQLPQELQLRFGNSLPATVQNRPVQDQDVARLTARVPMRSQSIGNAPARGPEADMLQRAMIGMMQHMSARQHMQPDLLPGLQIFRQSGSQAAVSQQQQLLPATPATAASVAAAPQPAAPAVVAAAPQLALPAPAALPSTTAHQPQPRRRHRSVTFCSCRTVPVSRPLLWRTRFLNQPRTLQVLPCRCPRCQVLLGLLPCCRKGATRKRTRTPTQAQARGRRLLTSRKKSRRRQASRRGLRPAQAFYGVRLLRARSRNPRPRSSDPSPRRLRNRPSRRRKQRRVPAQRL